MKTLPILYVPKPGDEEWREQIALELTALIRGGWRWLALLPEPTEFSIN